jgi:hypothetical protein
MLNNLLIKISKRAIFFIINTTIFRLLKIDNIGKIELNLKGRGGGRRVFDVQRRVQLLHRIDALLFPRFFIVTEQVCRILIGGHRGMMQLNVLEFLNN